MLQRRSRPRNPYKWGLVFVLGMLIGAVLYWLWKRYRNPKEDQDCLPCPEKECPKCPIAEPCPEPQPCPEHSCPDCPKCEECLPCPEHTCPTCPTCPTYPTPCRKDFDLSYVSGKRGKLRVEGKGYLQVKPGQSASANPRVLTLDPSDSGALIWIVGSVTGEKQYTFEEAGTRNAANTRASFLSITSSGEPQTIAKPLDGLDQRQKFSIEYEGGWSNRFHLINPVYFRNATVLTSADWILFEEVTQS